MIARYFVFAYDTYYPLGGWNDFKGAFDTLEEARKIAQQTMTDNYQIVDVVEDRIVDEYHGM